MLRTRTLLQHSVAISIALAFPLAGAACGGREISLGANQSPLTEIDPSAVAGTVPACGPNAAHPNVCCHADVGSASKCGVHDGAPFQACEDGWKTYPDPRECCDLTHPASCAPPPPPPVTPPPFACGYACPPGWFPGGDEACCRTFPDGSGECFASAGTGVVNATDGGTAPDSGTSCVPPHPTPGDAGLRDAGSAPDTGPIDAGGAPDAGDIDGGACYPPPPPYPPPPAPPPTPPPCDLSCPAGWVRAHGEPDVCCREVGPGVFDCFSQAGGGPHPPPPPPPQVDAGPPTIHDGGVAPGRACFGSSNGDCGCSEDIGGKHFEVRCSDSSASCTCISSDGVSTPIPNRKVCGGGASGLGSVWVYDCLFP